jgi:ABC-type antimicrobial peptide transport system permease subunit
MMPVKWWPTFLKRTEVIVGGTVGAILTLAVAGTVDLFVPLGEGGWSQAIRQSIRSHLGQHWEDVLWLKIAVGFTAFLIMVILGALIGVLFGIAITRFFRFMFDFIDRHEGK